MNKKFLSVILFSALMVGTAGTFTSCKDYDDDIESLDNRVSAVEKLVSDLQAKIDAGSVITGVDKTEDGIVIKLSNGESYPIKNGTNGTNAPVWSIVKDASGDYWWAKDNVQTEFPARGEKGEPGNGSAGQDAKTIYYYPGTEETGKLHGQAEAGYWVKVTEEKGKDPLYEVQTTKWLPEGTLSAVWNTEDQTLTLGNMKDENGKLVEKTISLSTKLRSLVFIPDLYEDGVEATKYPYVPGQYVDATKNTAVISGEKDAYNAKYTILKDNKISWKVPAKPVNYWLNPIATVNYHLNPLNAKINDVTWKFLGATPEYITTKAATPAVVTPNFLNAEKIDGQLAVNYQLSKTDLEKNNLSYPGKNEEAPNYISIAAIEGTLANEEGTVTSDYAAIMPVVQNLKGIAYNDYTTKVESCKEELYKTAEDAIKNLATIPVLYNGGAIELNDYLNIHYIEKYLESPEGTETHKVLKYADAVSKYGLKFQYEPVHYTSGKSKTEENAYSKLTEDGTFTPCYVNDKGETVEIAKGNTDATGRSAVGRRPIVLVKLVDTNNNNAVVLAGYIRLEISAQIGFKAIVIDKSEPQQPYLCNGFEQGITWADMSGKVLEELNLTKDEFTRGFGFTTGKTYISDGKGGLKEVVNNIYGSLAENEEDDATSTNPILTWTATKTQMDKVIADYKDRTLTLYAKYQSKSDVNYSVYIGIKVTVAEMPTTSGYGNKRDAYWYPKETALADRDTVRTNVPAPATSGDVMAYNKNLEDYFYHMVKENGKDVEKAGIEFFASDASKAVYEEIWGDLGIKYKYTFSAKNKDVTIGDKKLFINADGTQLLWGAKEAEAKLIATIEGTTIKYNKAGAEAKEFLNLFGHNELKPNQQFAIIEVSATYGDCNLKLAPAYNFNARFLRPLDIESNDKAEFQDAEANGSSVLLGNLFKANDWRDKAVIVYNSENKKYEAAKENNVNLYEYYGIKQIVLDLDNATCDVNNVGTQMPINKEVIKLTTLTKAEDGTPIEENKIDVTDINKLNEVVLNYQNNLGNTQDFTIMVPVKVTYAWGEVEAAVAIAVKGTIANR